MENMQFNVGKCVVMHLGVNNKLYTYDVNNVSLETGIVI